MLHYILINYLRSVDDKRVYTFVYKSVQARVILRAEVGSKCTVAHHYAYYKNFSYFYG